MNGTAIPTTPRRKGGAGRAILILFAALGILLIVATLAFVFVGAAAVFSKGRVPSTAVLEIDFEKGVEENPPDDPFGLLRGKHATVFDLVEALEKASTDSRIKGVMARVGAAPFGLARCQEVRDAVIAFRKSGKRAIAYSDTYGEFGPGNGAYYVATAFDKIYMQPSGDVGLTGMMYESPFIKGTLDKLAIVPRMDHRKEYKNAMNMYTEEKYTEPHREAMTKIMESQFGQIVRGIAQARGMTEDEVRSLVNRGPFLGQEALDAKLVDALAYRDQVLEAEEPQMGGSGVQRIGIARYLTQAGRPYSKGNTIALIYGVGAVVRGKNGFDPIMGGQSMGSETVAAAFRDAIEDDDVKAIVFRVDSPGGSYVASDSIWRETMHAKDKGKPIIVTMGDLAGSGGYFVAIAADKIVAQPGTITGSIGVLGGKLVTTGLYKKLGITFDEVHVGDRATMWSGTIDYTPDEWTRFESWLDRVYDDFTTKVSEGRKIPKERVLEIAKGRIWSGEDAKELKLVDELGGFPTALRLAREAAGLAPDAPINLKHFPPKRTPFEQIMASLNPENEDETAITTLEQLRQVIAPYRPVLRSLGYGPRPDVLSMPPMEPAY